MDDQAMVNPDDPLLLKSRKRQQGDRDGGSPSKKAKPASYVPRSYQIEVVEKALSQNTILFLETGTGKTFIAVLLVRELAGRLLMAEEKRIAVFLAPTVQLVNQQAEFFSAHLSDLRVGVYHSHKVVDIETWNSQRWRSEVDTHHVVVMTPQVFYYALESTAFDMNLVEILIIDECHHAQKNHVYASIMKTYYHSANLRTKPRIFGMTASLVSKGVSATLDYARRISDLEAILNSKVYIVKNREELEAKAPAPFHRANYYIKPFVDFDTIRCRLVSVQEEFANRNVSASENQLTEDKNRISKSIKKLHRNIDYCLVELGIWCALLAVDIYIETHSNTPDAPENEIEKKHSLNFLREVLAVLRCSGPEGFSRRCDNAEELKSAVKKGFVTPKVQQLIIILMKYRTADKLRAIVFVERVITSKVLIELLKSIGSLGFLRASYLTGKNTAKSAESQHDALKCFRDGQLNLLVATSVAEEGLDVQMCNTVVRFDLCTSLRSYIQSRGRARKTGAEYIWLLEKGNLEHEQALLRLSESEKAMKDEALSRIGKDTDNELVLDEDLEVLDLGSGVRISTSGSINLIHQFCSKLPGDRFSKPDFTYVETGPGCYTCSLTFPPNSPLKKVEGSPRRTKQLSKKTACLEACRVLFGIGALTATSIRILPADESRAHAPGLGTTRLKELVPSMSASSTLQGTWIHSSTGVQLSCYTLAFFTEAREKELTNFAFLVERPLDDDAANFEVDLYNRKGKTTKSRLSFSGHVRLEAQQVAAARLYQEIMLNGAFGRLVSWKEGEETTHKECLLINASKSKDLWWQSYLLLPLNGDNEIDWTTISSTASAGEKFKKLSVFPQVCTNEVTSKDIPEGVLRTAGGAVQASALMDCIVLTIHTGKIFCIEKVLYDKTADSPFSDNGTPESYREFFLRKYGRLLEFPRQPLLLAKPTHAVHNHLMRQSLGGVSQAKHFVNIPPEFCLVLGSKSSIIRSLYLVPSFMHRLTAIIIASELRAKYRTHAHVHRILEAITSSRCQEGFSYESLEVLGDSFLKFAVTQKMFLVHADEDEGQLSERRSTAISNATLRNIAVASGIHAYIRDEPFHPTFWVGAGMFCIKRKECLCILNNLITDGSSLPRPTEHDFYIGKTCGKGHRWLCSKTMADVVEGLIGAYALDGGFAGASEFMKAIGIDMVFDPSLVSYFQKTPLASPETLEQCKAEVECLEKKLSYTFINKSLLLQAITHPSCPDSNFSYQRLEFLGDAALDLLITDHLFRAHAGLSPDVLTQLRAAAVNNNCFARVAVKHDIHSHLRHDSAALNEQVMQFALAVNREGNDANFGYRVLSGPKVLGDLMESIAGAILLDLNFNLEELWKRMKPLLSPIVTPEFVAFHPVRQLDELCFDNYLQQKWNNTDEEETAVVVQAKEKRFVESSREIRKDAARLDAALKMLRTLKEQGYKTSAEKASQEGVPQGVADSSCLDVAGGESISLKPIFSNGDSSSSLPSEATEAPPSAGGSPSKSAGLISKPLSGTIESTKSEPTLAAPSNMEAPGAARSYLHQLCAQRIWTRPKFEDIEKAVGCLKVFASRVLIDTPERGSMSETGEFMASKKKAKDDAAIKMVHHLRREGLGA